MRELQKYSVELKAEAGKMVLEQGLTQQETGKRLSIPKGNIGNWVSAAKAALGNGSPGEQSVGALAAENARLRKELAEVRMEREILKKPPRTSQRSHCQVRVHEGISAPVPREDHGASP
jgi:transposase